MDRKEHRNNRIDWDKVARIFFRTITISPARDILELLKELQTSRDEVDEKVTQVSSALENASKLVTELETELTTKVEQVNKLKTEYERYQKLANLEEKNAKALIEELQKTLDTERSRERWTALILNIVAGLVVFILGVWLSPWIKTFFGISQ